MALFISVWTALFSTAAIWQYLPKLLSVYALTQHFHLEEYIYSITRVTFPREPPLTHRVSLVKITLITDFPWRVREGASQAWDEGKSQAGPSNVSTSVYTRLLGRKTYRLFFARQDFIPFRLLHNK